MKYKKGYKYQLVEDYLERVPRIYSFPVIHGDFYDINDKEIFASKGYSWDGPSGPTIDDKTNMRAALVHDIIYQALREFPEKFKDHEATRRDADELLKYFIIKDGGSRARAWYYYNAVRLFARYAADPDNKKMIIEC